MKYDNLHVNYKNGNLKFSIYSWLLLTSELVMCAAASYMGRRKCNSTREASV